MILFSRVYAQLETLGPLPEWGRYHRLLRGTNDLTSPVGRETIVNMSHQVLNSSLALFLGGSL